MPPNIILFMTDSMDGRVMRHLGHPAAHTPNNAISLRLALSSGPA